MKMGKKGIGYSYETIKGLRTSYIKLGKGPALLFIPGLLSTAVEYSSFFRLLKGHFTVFAVNLPGFGPSQEPQKPYSVDEYGDFVVSFMKSMGMRQAVLMGHSAGGFVALNVALRYPKKVLKLVLMDSAGLKLEHRPRALAYRLLVVKAWRELRNAKGWKMFLSLLPRALFGTLICPFRGNLWNAVKRSIRMDYENRLGGIKTPTILIWGRDDKLFSLGYARKFNSLIPNSRLFIVEGGHNWPALCPEINWRKIKPKIL